MQEPAPGVETTVGTATAPAVAPTVPTATTAPGEDPATATAPALPAPPATTTPQGATTTEIGPGDEEAARIPADFTISGGGVTPGRITVPAFLTVALRASSGDGREHTLRLSTPRGPVTLRIPPGGAASREIPGLPAGEYLIALDGQATDAALVVGGEPGP